MKKSLVALAVASVASLASAQSSVTIYGVVDTGYSNYSSDAAGGGRVRLSGLSSSNTITSRLGFRGVEDLGGGMKAKFNLEMGINTDDGAGQITTNTSNTSFGGTTPGTLVFGRLAWVGLETRFGEFRLGRDLHPGYLNYVVFDPFGAVGAGASLASVLEIDHFASTGAHIRFSNGISYFLPPNLGGIYGHLAYAPSEAPSNSVASATTPGRKDGEAAGVRLGYRSGPVDVAVAYAKVKASVTGAAPTGFVSQPIGSSNDRETSNIAGTYDFGAFKLWGQYSYLRVDNYRNNADVTNKSFMIGATAPVGAHLFKASIAQSDSSGQNSGESTKFGLGYEYRLSKRTAFYTSAAIINNKNGGRLGVGALSTVNGAYASSQFASGFAQPNGGVGAGGGAVATNGKSRGFDIGLRHTF